MIGRINIFFALALGLTTACALPAPPYIPAAPGPDTRHMPDVSVIEGQPRGILLDLRLAPLDAAREATIGIAVLRRAVSPEEKSDFEMRFSFDPETAPDLWQRGRVSLLDNQVAVGTTYEYTAVAKTENGVVYGPDLARVTWTEPPTAPENVSIEAVGAQVLVRWSQEEGMGAVVFRKRLGVKGSYKRLDAPEHEKTGSGLFVDQDLLPATVYVYRVSKVRRHKGLLMVGQPSPEVYVSTMKTGPLFTPKKTPEEP